MAASLATPLPRIPFTYEDYCYLPDDGRRHELALGEFYVTPAPAPLHQTVSRRLQHALMTALEDRGVAFVYNAPIDVIFDQHTVLQPDLAIVATTRAHLVSKRGIEGPPDIVVEILSPSSRDNDVHLKRTVYAHFGVPEYWIIDPDLGSIEALQLGEAGYTLRQRYDRTSTLTTPAFSEVSVVLAPVFKPLVP